MRVGRARSIGSKGVSLAVMPKIGKHLIYRQFMKLVSNPFYSKDLSTQIKQFFLLKNIYTILYNYNNEIQLKLKRQLKVYIKC